jgi:hypothetical protein
MEIRKRDGAVLTAATAKATDAVANSATAERMAAALSDNAGLPGESGRQAPFTAIDKGHTWVVRGSYNANHTAEGLGPFYVEFRKRDARVLDIGFEGILHIPPEVKEALHTGKRGPPGQ